MSRYFAPAIAIGTGLVVLLGYFFENSSLGVVRIAIVQWAVILAGAAVFVGVINLIAVHANKIFKRDKDRVYSLLLIAALLLTLSYGFLNNPSDPVMVNIFNGLF